MNFYVSFLNNIALNIVANNIKYVWQLTVFFCPSILFIFIVICFVTYWLIYLFFSFVLCINVVNLLSIKKKSLKKIFSWNFTTCGFFFINKRPFIHGSFFLSRFTSIYKGFMGKWIHLKKLKWRIHDGRWFQILLQNKWRHQDITAIVKDY